MLANRRTPILLLIAAFFIRLFYVFAYPVGDSIRSDIKNYVEIGEMITNGVWLENHFFQPIGFPMLLGGFQLVAVDWPFWFGIFQVVLSTLTLSICWLVTKRCFGTSLATKSLFVGTFHLPWIAYTGFALTETIFTFLLSILALFSLKIIRTPQGKNSVLWGITYAVAMWFKSTHALLLPLFLFFSFKSKMNSSGKLWLKSIAMPILLVFLVSMVAHGLLTLQTIGKFQMGPSAAGFNLVEGKCPTKRNIDADGKEWMSPLYFQLGHRASKKWDFRVTESREFFWEGLKCIGDNPFTLVTSIENVGFLFTGNFLWPVNQLGLKNFAQLYDLVFAIFSIVGLSVFFLLCWRSVDKELISIWALPIISLFLCVYIFKSEIRFRLPFDVWIIPAALAGWNFIFAALRANSPTLPAHESRS